MQCVVTAGPAYEPIDQVRRLTNFSTGRLGTELARYLARKGHSVLLLRGETATYHADLDGLTLRSFSTASDLANVIASIPPSQVKAFFHAAAVGDFRCGRVWRRDGEGNLQAVEEGKVSSRQSDLFLQLLPAPKIIATLRDHFPGAWLVGWKYEVEGSRTSLAAKAELQLREYHIHACVLNGPAYGEGFGWVTGGGSLRHVPDESALFEILEENVSHR